MIFRIAAATRQQSRPLPASPPNPAAGIFETMLVAEGRPIELDAHLSRLEASILVLYGIEPPALRERVAASAAAESGFNRLRVTTRPSGDGGLGVEVVTAPVQRRIVFPGLLDGASLATFVTPAGLGEHKWADRSQLEGFEARCPGALPLLIDGEATVLETSRANLFAVCEGRLATPPLDGRILPGVARARVVEAARSLGIAVEERPVSHAELLSCDEVFLTGSVRGVEPVVEIDGWQLPGAVALTQRLADALAARWLSP